MFAVIPLAVLTQPYFRADVPRYIPYATIGVIFAHEMLHGFDLTGIGYDAEGEATDWFSRESLVRLEARLDCVARQYAATFRKKVSFMGANIDVQVRKRNIDMFCRRRKLCLWTSEERNSRNVHVILNLFARISVIISGSRDSSVGVKMGYEVEGRGLILSRGKIFLFTSKSILVLEQNQSPIRWVLGAISLGVKRPGRQANHSPPSRA
jgi:hypothetical protein